MLFAAEEASRGFERVTQKEYYASSICDKNPFTVYKRALLHLL
jgi:hypothetical protein